MEEEKLEQIERGAEAEEAKADELVEPEGEKVEGAVAEPEEEGNGWKNDPAPEEKKEEVA